MFLALEEVEELAHSCSFLGFEADKGLDPFENLDFT